MNGKRFTAVLILFLLGALAVVGFLCVFINASGPANYFTVSQVDQRLQKEGSRLNGKVVLVYGQERIFVGDLYTASPCASHEILADVRENHAKAIDVQGSIVLVKSSPPVWLALMWRLPGLEPPKSDANDDTLRSAHIYRLRLSTTRYSSGLCLRASVLNRYT